MEKYNLYKYVMEGTHDEYDRGQIQDKLGAYSKYLDGVITYYRNNPITFDYKIQKQSKPNDNNAKQQKPTNDPNTWIILDKLDGEHLRHVMDGDHVSHVLELESASGKNKRSSTKSKIKIKKRDITGKRLLLERRPRTRKLGIEQNTYQIKMQRNAIKSLLHTPKAEHFTLLKLFHDRDVVELDGDWEDDTVKKWFVLKSQRGANMQKEFVKKALATPDFAFLEGPPGSGKTTALCELVHQLARQGKRVLFCASTHIAVDNLLEKITDKYTKEPVDSNIIPLRIGRPEKISPSIEGYLYENVTKTIKEKITNHLEGVSNRNTQQELLYKHLKSDDAVGQIARDCANLVCGTTIGILQHTDIKMHNRNAMFDVMIIDEASKTTFQEFLVPALHARRWIIVGDTRQLAPHTSQDEVKMHVDKCIDFNLGQACCDAFLASNKNIHIVVTDNVKTKKYYELQCNKLGVNFQDADNSSPTWSRGGIILGTPKSLAKLNTKFIQNTSNKHISIRGLDAILAELNELRNPDKKIKLWEKLRSFGDVESNEDHEWGSQTTWRIISNPVGGGSAGGKQKKIAKDVEKLMPADVDQRRDVCKRLEEVKKIALPSILQLLQHGYGPDEDTIMTEGIPEEEFEERYTLLEWQYRMHDEIAEFPRTHVYEESALRTTKTVNTARRWKYKRYGRRSVWINAKGGGRYFSQTEAKIISNEILEFYEFARKHRRGDKLPWDVAVLTFYTKQQQTMLNQLGKISEKVGQHQFHMKDGKKIVMEIQCQTLDSFQGHEADIVFLSIASDRPTIFLENPNRVNVAITRARYQNVIVGNHGSMTKSKSLLGSLAQETMLHEDQAQ